MVPPVTSTTGATTTIYRVNLHRPRRPSPLNPASRKAPERQSRTQLRDDTPKDVTRGARTVSPAQKILRRKAAKTLQTNSMRKQVEAYEAKALQGLATKTTKSTLKITASNKGKGKDISDGSIRIGVAVTSSLSSAQPSKKKRRRRWGALWMFLRSRPLVASLGSIWPFESKSAPELAWRPGEQAITASAP